jgi:hypothetical protein
LARLERLEKLKRLYSLNPKLVFGIERKIKKIKQRVSFPNTSLGMSFSDI